MWSLFDTIFIAINISFIKLHLKLIIINQKALIKFQVFLLFQILKIYSYQRQFQKVYYNLSLSDYYRLNLFSI